MNSLKIVFMGTPQFAVTNLEKLYHSHHQIVGVVSQPDRPRGRGKKLQPTPVKQFALDHHLSPILQPVSLKEPDFVKNLHALNADVFVVVAFRILPEIIFTMPPKGTINLHPSLLPKYRGAAPLNWAIMRGEEKTGITTIFIKKEIDAGNIILQEDFPILKDETVGSLHDRIAPAGANILLRSLDLIAKNAVQPREQDASLVTSAPKIKKETCRINFNQPAEIVKNHIHGLSPIPGAFTGYQSQVLKIYKTAQIENIIKKDAAPGEILKANKKDLWIACNPGAIAIHELQLQGKKRIAVDAFLRGVGLDVGTVLDI